MARVPTQIVVAAVFVLVAACGGDDDTAASTTVMPTPDTAMPTAETADAETTAPATSDTTTGQYSDESPQDWAGFEPAFMAGCSIDLAEEQCACMFEEFQSRYEFADFFNWAYEAGQDDPRIVEVADLCSP